MNSIKNFILCGFLLLSCLFTGCALFGGGEKPPKVSDSQLNSLQITYTPAVTNADFAYVNIISSGYIHLKKGRSPLVQNSFSQNIESPYWNDIREEKLGVPPEVTRAWIQKFFNAGLASEVKKSAKRVKDPDFGKKSGMAKFAAKVDRKDYFAVTDNQDLIAPLLQLISIIEAGKEYK